MTMSHAPAVQQQCRLCLHYNETADDSELLTDIFTPDELSETPMIDKIRDCLGIFIAPSDSAVRFVCCNCARTVELIDEFRILCHQTAEVYDALRIKRSTADADSWQQYCTAVSTLRTFVRQLQGAVNDALCKTKAEEDDVEELEAENMNKNERVTEEELERAHLLSSGSEPMIDFVVVKVEALEPIEPVADIVNESNDNDRLTIALKIGIAQEVKQRPELWDISFTSSAQTINESWTELACKLGLDIATLKRHWRRIRDGYRELQRRESLGDSLFLEDPTTAQLFSLCKHMFDSAPKQTVPRREQSKLEESANEAASAGEYQKMAHLRVIYKHPVLWNVKHIDYHSREARENAWDLIGEELNISAKDAKRSWRNMRGKYRLRVRRLAGSKISKEDFLINQPLYKILDEMLSCVPARGSPKEPKVDASHSEQDAVTGVSYKVFENDKRLQFAQICYGHEILWNNQHPDYNVGAKKDKVWDEIAVQMEVTRAETRYQWSRLRGVYRRRRLRLLDGTIAMDDPILNDPLYKLLDDMLGESMQIGKKSGVLMSAQQHASGPSHSEPDAATGVSYKVFENDKRLQLAQICYEHEILWNNQHPDYNVGAKNDKVWDEIALQMEVTRAEARYQWSRLRGVYRGRRLRLLDGTIAMDDPMLNDPLYKLLEDMLGESMQIGKNSGALLSAQQHSGGPFQSIEQQIELLEEIAKHEILWNPNHPDHFRTEMRTAAWKKVAAKFNVNPLAVKTEWKRLKDVHVSREDQAQDADTKRLLVLLQRLLPPAEKPSVTVERRPDESKRRKPRVGAESKRRFHGKKTYDSVGCVKIDRNGTMRHHKICELCGKPVERSMFEYHMNQHNGVRPYACSFEGCDKRYSNKITRDRHEVILHGDDGFKFDCDQCGAKFKQRAKFELHYAVKHKSEEVPCNICGKLLKHRHLLRKHIELHTSSFTCKVCGKALQKKWSLKVHMRVHTQEKPYPCELCELRFMLKVQMKTHLLKVHGVLLEDIEAAKANLAGTV
ncbi:uncharacterized protein LOC129727580 [Wyeomyia smithii]|uniref:uncharacterized protein LOC129727580 n=1 Tax=Wyeomyia smithii TaxID=174621 RepID=UPI002467D25F|nr:uncharacterized protein LOC129727580 [Wyeomyia smithii]